MELSTRGRNFYPNYIMPLWYTSHETFDGKMGLNTRFRLTFFETGTGLVKIGPYQLPVVAPALICLNENEECTLERDSYLKACTMYFHPQIVNARYSFANILLPDDTLSETDRQDLWCFKPFLERDSRYIGHLPLAPTTARRLYGLMESVDRLISIQPDDGWPCRGRSYFLELLFLVERIFSARDIIEGIVLPDTSPEMEKIILYLHLNYQKSITIGELTSTFHLNRTTLAERFLKETGNPPIAYLTRLRINLASMLLRDTELAVSEIIERVGFHSLTHFGRVFREHTGLTPSEYRQKYCWMISR